MKVILLEKVNSLGAKGEIKEVSEGYARNFLFPKKLAALATAEKIREAEARKKKEDEEKKSETDSLRKIADSIRQEKVEINLKGKDGKLFGSVNAKDIIKKLKEKGYSIDGKGIVLKSPIKEMGEYSVEVNLGSSIRSEVKVIIGTEK